MQARGATTDDFLSALREQHVSIDNCNDRLQKAREVSSEGNTD